MKCTHIVHDKSSEIYISYTKFLKKTFIYYAHFPTLTSIFCGYGYDFFSSLFFIYSLIFKLGSHQILVSDRKSCIKCKIISNKDDFI